MTYFRSQPGAQAHPIHLDITDRAAYARAADEAERTFGPVQLLCNTAGVSQFGPMQSATYEDWDWQLSVNLGGVENGIQTFVPRMLKHGLGAHIVNTASMSGFLSLPGTGIYSITLKKIADGAETPVKMPSQARISHVKFSPDGSHLAFLQTKDDAIELWIADGATGAAKAVVTGSDRINATTGDPCDWLRDNVGRWEYPRHVAVKKEVRR
jgi:NAD(P)-dependent dehydrogenase (short-subunit alcohol dehydrogenase family)